MRYKGRKYVLRTVQYRLKTTARLTNYFDSMYSESHMWINAGCQAARQGVPYNHCQKIFTLLRSIPQAFAQGAVLAGMEMGCSHVKYGKKYPLYSSVPLAKRCKGDAVYFPKCNTPFKLQKGNIPDTSQSYKIVDVTNHTDKERQFELHVTIREHIPERVATGIHAGGDMGGRHTLVVGKSDGTTAVLTLREKDTLRNIARIQKKMSRCTRGSHKWNRLHDQLQSVYKKMDNRQTDKLRKFSKKLMRQCDSILLEGMNLRTMTTKGPGQKQKNKMMRQSKCGKAREHIAQQSLKYNVEYNEINPRNTSKQCCMCGSLNTERYGGFKVWHDNIVHKHKGYGRKFKCHDCGVLMHADFNAAYNILFAFNLVLWSKRIQAVRKLQDKAGMVLRGRIHLGACTIPPSANDVIAGTGGHEEWVKTQADNERLPNTPLDGIANITRKSDCMYGKTCM